jgi:hypothetical protein
VASLVKSYLEFCGQKVAVGIMSRPHQKRVSVESVLHSIVLLYLGLDSGDARLSCMIAELPWPPKEIAIIVRGGEPDIVLGTEGGFKWGSPPPCRRSA